MILQQIPKKCNPGHSLRKNHSLDSAYSFWDETNHSKATGYGCPKSITVRSLEGVSTKLAEKINWS